MCATNSSFPGEVDHIPQSCARFSYLQSTMSNTKSTFNDSIGTPFQAASLQLPLSAMRPTYTSLQYLICTPRVATMRLHLLIGTSFKITLLLLLRCAMSVIQTPPFTTNILVHPSKLHRFNLARHV